MQAAEWQAGVMQLVQGRVQEPFEVELFERVCFSCNVSVMLQMEAICSRGSLNVYICMRQKRGQ